MLPNDLELPYLEWKRHISDACLSDEDREWLEAWEAYDLACSPMDDGRRRVLRAGHWRGWMAARSAALGAEGETMTTTLKPGTLTAKCKNCSCKFAYGRADCFVRYEVTGMISSGQLERTAVVYTRCPTCAKRIRVTGRVPLEAVGGNEDPHCKCEGMSCHCED